MSIFDLGDIYACRSVSSRCIQWLCDVYGCDYAVPCSYLCFSAATGVSVDYLTNFYNKSQP